MSLRTLIAFCLFVLSLGCDQRAGSNAAASSVPPPSADARYETYRQTIQPVVNELYGIESLIEHPNTLDLPSLSTQVKAVNFAFTKINGNITDEDKDRDSYKSMMAGMDSTLKAFDVWQKSQDAADSVNSDTSVTDAENALVAVLKARTVKANHLVDAEVAIVKMKDLLASKR